LEDKVDHRRLSQLIGLGGVVLLVAGCAGAMPTPAPSIPASTPEPAATFTLVVTQTQEATLLAEATIEPTEAIVRNGLAKYEPPDGKVIVFIGQDNASVGGNDGFHDGYVENVGVPGGITHYVYMVEGWTNAFGYTFDVGHIDGLYTETTWGAGPMCMACYLDSPILDDSVMHLSISMEGNSEDRVADGSYDHLIDELIRFLNDHADTPFLIRIGYEFEGPWNGYDPENFQLAFRRIVDRLREAGVMNFATVMGSASFDTPYATWEQYYPGDEYVDWVAYSYWGGNSTTGGSLQFARDHNKPVFIAESTPRAHYLDREDGREVWETWFETYFQHIEDNIDVVKAISYINCDWDAQPMWDGWGDTRIEVNDYVRMRWLETMQTPQFVNAQDGPFALIGFLSKK
jgi:hypothetical protein